METRYTIVDGELRHYGVLGMKWGIRKARKAGVEYAYKSHGQKKYIKKVSKLEKKGKTGKSLEKAQKKLDTFKQRDRNRLDYVKSTGVGRSIAKGIIMGPFGSGSYNRLRAAGHGRVTSALISNVVVSTFSLPVNLLLTRGSEFKSANVQRRAIENFKRGD